MAHMRVLWRYGEFEVCTAVKNIVPFGVLREEGLHEETWV